MRSSGISTFVPEAEAAKRAQDRFVRVVADNELAEQLVPAVIKIAMIREWDFADAFHAAEGIWINLVAGDRNETTLVTIMMSMSVQGKAGAVPAADAALRSKSQQEIDPVDHPQHYTSHPSGVECIEITEHLNFNVGNAIKYLWRAGLKSKDPLEDLKKGLWYVQREIDRLTPKPKPVMFVGKATS